MRGRGDDTHWVLELRVHLRDDGPHALELGEHVLRVVRPTAHQARHLVDHRPDASRERAQLPERLLEHGREREEAERVAGRRGVEHDDGVLHRLDVLHDLRERHRLVDARDREREVLHHAAHHALVVRCTNARERRSYACRWT